MKKIFCIFCCVFLLSSCASQPKDTSQSLPQVVIGKVEDPLPDETWQQYQHSVEGINFTFKLPPFLYIDETDSSYSICCNLDSEYYRYFEGREGAAAGFSYTPAGGSFERISDTEYDVPEVGQSFRYVYSTSLEPLTFFTYKDFTVFVSGPSYYLPTQFYNEESGLVLWLFFSDEPEIPIEIFKQIVSTIEIQ
ncbi:hypothetical protein LJC61_01780 [Ruminococcaceae bacterium OttesenSCG-928-A16]|nr:hypothetical protein [Ruminococcaceae bacterium OttesenSCG-928-A16]